MIGETPAMVVMRDRALDRVAKKRQHPERSRQHPSKEEVEVASEETVRRPPVRRDVNKLTPESRRADLRRREMPPQDVEEGDAGALLDMEKVEGLFSGRLGFQGGVTSELRGTGGYFQEMLTGQARISLNRRLNLGRLARMD